ncbi:MAG: acetate--CoA ligase family protein [Acidobacteriota bacterium]
MPAIDFEAVAKILDAAHDEGREGLFEHECYELLAAIGAEAAPACRIVRVGQRPCESDLDRLPGDRVVLKIVSPDITHKTEAEGVRIVAREMEAVNAAFDQMLEEVPATYAAFLESHAHEMPPALAGLRGPALEKRLADRTVGVLLCSFVPSDATGFATELFVGIRHTDEFGPIISAGLGGVEMEILARTSREGPAVAIAPTGMVDGSSFFELFRATLSYQRLSGRMRGSRRMVEDTVFVECFQAFIDLANHFSPLNPEARFLLRELEVNPFAISGARIAPLDGVCSFTPAAGSLEVRPVAKISHLLKPSSAAVIGVSDRGMNMGRIILNNLFDAGFDRSRAFVVHPTATTIDGVPCVPSVADLPHKVDLFVVAVGAPQVPGIVTDLVDHDRANAVILIPGGLGEKEGSKELEKELKNRIRSAHQSADGGPVFLGGNSLGVISHPGRYDTMFIPDSKLPKSRSNGDRKLCFVSQSGAFIISNISRMPWLDPAYALNDESDTDHRQHGRVHLAVRHRIT